MLSLLVFGNLLGLVQVPLFSLCLTSFMFLTAKPVMLYDLSLSTLLFGGVLDSDISSPSSNFQKI